MSIPNVNKTRISVVTKPTNVSVSTAGVRGRDGITQDISLLNDFTASYYIDSASIVNLINQATNEQDLSNYALLSGSNNFIGNQFVTGSITLTNRLNFTTGSFINSQIQIEAFLTNYTLLEIVNYSSSSFDDLEASTYNLTNGVPAPWTAFRLAPVTLPVSSIEVNDILAGTSIIPSTIKAKGGSGFTDIVVVNLDLTGLLQILPVTGSNFQLLRPLVKPALTIQTPSGTDIFLNSQGLGDTIVNTNIVPLVTAQNKLGLPTRRWKEVWVGSGSIYMQDETLGIDLRMSARDGDFIVDGAAGLRVGEFILRDNEIGIKNSTRDIEFGVDDATGYINFNRPLRIKSLLTGNTTFQASREGRIQIITPIIPAGDVGALSIIGNSSGSYQPVINPSGMLHITSNDGQAARVTVDGFGSSIGAIFVGRHARGTAALPTPTLSGDVLARFSGLGYSTSSYFPVAGGVPTSLEFQATENYSTSGAGSRAAFYTYANGATSRTLSAVIDTNGLILPNVPTNETENEILVWDSVTGRVGKQSGVSVIDGGAAASIFITTTEVLNGGGA
jgi:hypothetical protein